MTYVIKTPEIRKIYLSLVLSISAETLRLEYTYRPIHSLIVRFFHFIFPPYEIKNNHKTEHYEKCNDPPPLSNGAQ